MKIMVVDDEVDVVDFLSHFLTRLGFETVKATCGKEAIERFAEHVPEWVFLDMKMPDMNGIDVLKRLKEISPGLKALMITGRDDDSAKESARELGVLDYIIKPLSLEELRGKVNTLILQKP